MQTRSNSARTLPADGYDDFYADDRAVSPVEARSSDSEMFMENPVSGRWTKHNGAFNYWHHTVLELIFVNTDPETIEKRLGTKNAVKIRKTKATIPETDDEEDASKQMQKENKGRKTQTSTSGASSFAFLLYLLILNIFFRQFRWWSEVAEEEGKGEEEAKL